MGEYVKIESCKGEYVIIEGKNQCYEKKLARKYML